MTVLSGGVIAFAAGTAALIGVGSSLVFAPIQKKIRGENMTVKGMATDIALGAVIGAITGPIGAGKLKETLRVHVKIIHQLSLLYFLRWSVTCGRHICTRQFWY